MIATTDRNENAAPGAGSASLTSTDSKLYRTVADAIASQIDAGFIPAGVSLNETMLAQLFKVSRTPARQALERLADIGLVCATPTRGFVTGQQPKAYNGRLTDFSQHIEAFANGLQSEARASDLFDELERIVTHISVVGSWRLSMRAALEHYDISRGALEDVLRELEFTGLLTRRPGGQWIISKMDIRRLEALFDVRTWLEPKLLEQATVNIPIEVLDDVISAHTIALEKLPDVTGSELDDLETMLHRQLMSYADNGPGLAALRSVNAGLILSKHVLATEEVPVGNEDPFIEEHLDVLGALKRRRSEECKLRLLAHLLKSREKCTARLQRYREMAKNFSCDFAKRIDE